MAFANMTIQAMHDLSQLSAHELISVESRESHNHVQLAC